MDWQTTLTDAGTIAAISTGIVIAIQFLKTIYYKLPWRWVQNTPGEVWFALSIIASLGVAIALNYQILLDTGQPLMDRFGTIFYGLTIGAGSKVIHAVATSAGAKLGASKADNLAKMNGTSCVTQTPPPEIPPISEPSSASAEVETLPLETEIKPEIKAPEPPKEPVEVSDAELFWKIPVNVDNYYVLVDNGLYHITKKDFGK
jgi:hypothetical protein